MTPLAEIDEGFRGADVAFGHFQVAARGIAAAVILAAILSWND